MVNIATVLNRLQQFIKDNDIANMSGDIPTGVSFSTSGGLIVKHTTSHVVSVPTLGKAAQYIHNKLDTIEQGL